MNNFWGLFKTIYSILANGFVFKYLWAWFFASTFSLPELNIMSAFGIVMTIGFIVESPKDSIQSVKTEEDDPVGYEILIFCAPWLYFVLGWIIHIFS